MFNQRTALTYATSPIVGVINTGIGNTFSLVNTIKKMGYSVILSDGVEDFAGVDWIILPGVGTASEVMKMLRKKEFDTFLRKTKTPLLGICLGMQILFSSSEEGNVECLDLIPGQVKKLAVQRGYALPHIGWNDLIPKDTLFQNLHDVYFVHSYAVETDDQYIVAEAEYGVTFPAIIRSGNIWGMQFHPEKSGKFGQKLLELFFQSTSAPMNTFELFPAIDILDGRCVRLQNGEYTRVTAYDISVQEKASEWEESGGAWLHLIDLAGARDGAWTLDNIVQNILRYTSLKLQVGGGIRDIEMIAKLLDIGVSRVILGTRALEDLDWLEEVMGRFLPENIVLSLDFADGMLKTHGWKQSLDISLDTLLQRLKILGVRYLITTDISSDGMSQGIQPNMAIQLKQYGFQVILAGGVSSYDNIQEARIKGLDGVVIGKWWMEA